MMKKISFATKLICLLTVAFVAVPTLAAWSDVPVGVTPAICPSSVPGCNTPINVSTIAQIKSGWLSVLGNLGVGVATPSVKLDVFGGTYGSASSSYLTTLSKTIFKIGNPSTGTALLSGIGPSVGLTRNVWLQSQSSDNTLQNIILNPAGGNVGIGTDNPVAKLQVNGQIKITGGSPGAGKVLTSDAHGMGSWQNISGGGSSQQQQPVGGRAIVDNNFEYIPVNPASPCDMNDGRAGTCTYWFTKYNNWHYTYFNSDHSPAFSNDNVAVTAVGDKLDPNSYRFWIQVGHVTRYGFGWKAVNVDGTEHKGKDPLYDYMMYTAMSY
jgi:hypothetical protein